MEKLISEFSLGLFFWQSLIFIGLLLLLRKFAWKPILNSVNEREASIKNALDSAEEARTQLENLQSENQRLLKEARKEKEILLKEALKTKNQIISDAKREAQNETEKILSQAQDTIQSEKRAALKELKNQVGSIAIDIAEKVINKELENKDKQMNLVNDLLKDTDFK